jgi:hypothetical protein
VSVRRTRRHSSFSGDKGEKPKKVNLPGHEQNRGCTRIVSERSARMGRKRPHVCASLLLVEVLGLPCRSQFVGRNARKGATGSSTHPCSHRGR